jgi:hypothetical protein
MKGSTILLIGGVAALFLLINGHYVVRYVHLNMGQPFDDWCPLIPKYPKIMQVLWSNTFVTWGWPQPIMYGKNLTMLQSYTPNIAEYAALSAKINASYCEKKGYRFKAIVSKKPAFGGLRNPCWDKVFYIIKEFELYPEELQKLTPEDGPVYRHMNLPRNDYKWIFWIDSDAVVSDTSKWIEAIGNRPYYQNADIYICTSIPLTMNVNTGAMLLRMTPWMYQFLKAWRDWPNEKWHQTMCHEQSALDEMIAKDHMGIVSNGKLALFGPTEFNSTYQHGLKMKGKFIQHYRGCSTAKRVAAFTFN